MTNIRTLSDAEKLAAANRILSEPAATWAERRAQIDVVLAFCETPRRIPSIDDRIASGEDVYRT